MSTAEKTLEGALYSPEDERASLAKALLTSLGRTPAEVEQACASEFVRPLERDAWGTTKAVPWDEAKRPINAAHGFE